MPLIDASPPYLLGPRYSRGYWVATLLRRGARAVAEKRPLLAHASVLEMTISGLSLFGLYYLDRTAEFIDAIDRCGICELRAAAEARRLLCRRCGLHRNQERNCKHPN